MLLDSVKQGQRDKLQEADSWAAFIAEARELLLAELAGEEAVREDDR